MPLFLEDLVDPFYEPVGQNFRNLYVRGQILYTHIGYTQQNLELWRPTGLDPSATAATSFRTVAAPGDAFRRGAPLHTPRLETNEEFPVVRAKRRPVILMSTSTPARPAQPVRGGGRVHRPLAIVIPVFSLVNRLTGQVKYDPHFVERMRMLEFPEFLYLPPYPGVLPVPSYARIGEAQAVYEPQLDAMDLKLGGDVLEVAQDAFWLLVAQTYGGMLAAYREQLVNQ
jgi:hypothetical protein